MEQTDLSCLSVGLQKEVRSVIDDSYQNEDVFERGMYVI